MPSLKLRVSAKAESILRSGHPWLFADSIRSQNRDGQAGEFAVVYDRSDRFLAIGLFDPESPLRVRVLHTGNPVTIDDAWWRFRFEAAIGRRHGLFDQDTSGYRLVHGENDGWPGLVLDRYGRVLVLKLYTSAWLPRLSAISSMIRGILQPQHLVLRLSRNIQETARDRFSLVDGQEAPIPPTTQPQAPPMSATASFLESGLVFHADVVRGQKTGFFLDQRENRRRVEQLSGGRSVLNTFSYSGAFSVYAARGGATSVTDLDISRHALESARNNFTLNSENRIIANCQHITVRADAFDWLEQGSPQRFGLIVLDPPSLAKQASERVRALSAYGRLVRGGIRMLAEDGILVAASCSAQISSADFFDAVRTACRHSRRPFVELETTGHPADHPALFPEANYLKCIYLRSHK